ncbi:DUF2971 domain-containing protein [Brucella pituitosa]|uniref:DUF2971 domain-containing protein n=1 Tax=Brucella pituitosa TaxID=571256 RepID=UPI000C280F63|nr:DUF2971 domain-containing protein [Brucella pituitosa]MCK4207395.1 DUF2971 domain-containing protein [Brucella pituitosa]PJO49404.1 hypothetical protein CWE02_06475 [Brucella pituitosa]
MTENTLRRYTNLASALHILHNRCLTLLSPETWDDRNDAYFMSEYKRLKSVKTVLAICIADREETYHHWQVFSRGADGVCIEFDREELLAAFDAAGGISHRYVDYELVTKANAMREVDLEILPFTKRWPYGDEREYRAIYVNTDKEMLAFPVPLALAAIKRITLSPWLAPALVEPVKKTLKSLPGCNGLRIYRSTLIDNKPWKKLTGRVVPPPTAP